jgi:transcriptional regulator with XRE-family HTH domain
MEPKGSDPLTPGRLIRQSRENRIEKMTQQDLANEVSKRLSQTVTKNMVTKIEGDNRELSFQEAVAFADALGIGLDRMADLLYRNDPNDLVEEAWRLIDSRVGTLSKMSVDDIEGRIKEIRDRVSRAGTDAPAPVAFIKGYGTISDHLQQAQRHLFAATSFYMHAAAVIFPPDNDDHGINDVEGYNPETGEFDDGTA